MPSFSLSGLYPFSIMRPLALLLSTCLLAALPSYASAQRQEILYQFVQENMRSAFLPGHLWSAPLVLHPDGNNDSYCYNPSFTVHEEVVWASVRCTSRDYFNPRYRRHHESSWLLTKGGYNRFVLASLPYDLRDLKRTVQLWHDIDVPLAQLPQYDPDNNYPGIQDARLFTFQNRIYFVSSTQLATPGLGGIADIGPVIGRLSEDRRRVEDAWLPEGTPRQARNLVPLVVGEAAYLLDVLDGLLYRFETPELRTATPVMQFPTLVGLGLRGGTNPVVLDEGAVLGVIAHSVYDVATDASLGFGHLRVDSEYVHFWVELNVLTGRVRVSRPFFLLTSGIEFASSLVLTGDDTQLVIGLGLNDQEAWLMGADLTKVRAMPMLVDDYAVEGSSAAPVEKAAVATGEGRGGRWAGMLSKLLGGRKETQVPVQKGGPGKQAQLGEVAQASAQAAGTGQLQGADGGAADRHVAAAGPGQNSEVQEL